MRSWECALIMGLVPLLSKTKELALSVSLIWRHKHKAAICKPKRGLSPGIKLAGTLSLDFLPSRTVRNESSLFKPSIRWCFIITALTNSCFPYFLKYIRIFHMAYCMVNFMCVPWQLQCAFSISEYRIQYNNNLILLIIFNLIKNLINYMI